MRRILARSVDLGGKTEILLLFLVGGSQGRVCTAKKELLFVVGRSQGRLYETAN